MGDPLTDWRFAGDFDRRRRELLLDSRHSFGLIVAGLSAGRAVCARWEWGEQPEVRGRVRAAFELAANEDAVDLFHNGIDGYRAAYYRSIEAGESANAAFLDVVAPILRREAPPWGLRSFAPGFPPDVWAQIADGEVERSLRAEGAKVWISEVALRERYGSCWSPTDSDEAVHDLRVQRWIDAINAASGQGGDVTRFAGTRAYCVDRIGVKGGFIMPGRPDIPAAVPVKKQKRSQQIHDRGFT